MFFAKDSVAVADYVGIGVGWGVYEDTNKLRSDYWEHTTQLVDKLSPTLVRTMISYEWVLLNFDNNGTEDVNDDTWEYTFDNKYMNSAYQILDYCQQNGIKVAFGAWNVVGQPDTDEWGMIKNTSADIRWAKITADVLEYLVKQRGYTCIKWFVSTNEPNYTGEIGSSKNAYNTYEKWAAGVKNVRNALDAVGLTDVQVVGGDTTGYDGSLEYMTGIAEGLTDYVDNYGVHLYVPNNDIDKGNLQNKIIEVVKQVGEIDERITDEHKLVVWEAGLYDGKDMTTDCNKLITTYSYAIRMADYTIQTALAGCAGVCYWDLDDGMYFMYRSDGTNAKEWGMFSTLATASSYMQEIRPWYHSSTLISNLLRPGVTVYSATMEQSSTFRALAAVAKDGSGGGILAVNRGAKVVTKSFSVEQELDGDTVYAYVFNEQNLRVDGNGFVIPNDVVKGSLNDKITIDIPANSIVLLATYPLIGGEC